MKTFLEKEKMLVTCNVFKKVLSSGSSKAGIVWYRVNSFPNNKVLVMSKLEAFPDNKINVLKTLKSILGSIENFVKKGKNG